MSDQSSASQVVVIHGKDVGISGKNQELVVNSPLFLTWAEMISPVNVPDEIDISEVIASVHGELTFAVLDLTLKLPDQHQTILTRVFLKQYLMGVLPIIEVDDEVYTILVTHRGALGDVSVVEIPTGFGDADTGMFKHPVTHWLKGYLHDFVVLGNVLHPSLEGHPEVVSLYALETILSSKAFAQMKAEIEATQLQNSPSFLSLVKLSEMIGIVTLESKSEVAYHRYHDRLIIDQEIETLPRQISR